MIFDPANADPLGMFSPEAEEVVRDYNRRHIVFEGLERPTWDEYFMAIAAAVALRADCRRRRIGAVIVDEDRRIISTGYNGAPSGAGSCLAGDCPRGVSDVASFTEGNQNHADCISLHAEQNAIAWADRSRTKGATVYIFQLGLAAGKHCPPCDMCGKLIKAAGIGRVVCQ
jgi:dCMP deaminase